MHRTRIARLLTHSAALAVILACMVPPPAQAQAPRGGPGAQRPTGSVVGQVIDGELDEPVSYATFILFTARDSSQVTGTISGKDGWFRLEDVPAGRYWAELSFLGYRTEHIDSIRVGPRANLNLGELVIHQSAVELEGVNYTVERSPVEYQIDRKVVRVDKQATAASGTAVDVLENVPSVSVDIEGNVSLRGSGNFRVLIDGRPTVLDANDALQQTPAGSIENIEIITNPSAKYDPEGTAGILNIVLKKERRSGHSGMLTVDGGWPARYGADGLYQLKLDGFAVTLGGDYNVRSMPGTRESLTRTTLAGIETVTESDGDMERGRDSYGLRGAIEGDLTPVDWISFGLRAGGHSGGHRSDLHYLEYGDTIDPAIEYESETDRERSEVYGTAFFEYRRSLPGEGHELAARLQGSWEDDDEKTTDQLLDSDGTVVSGRRSIERGPSSDLDGRIDYVLPFGEARKLEAGYRLQRDLSSEETGLALYDNGLGEYVDQAQFANTNDYDRIIQALYSIYADQWGPLGMQVGLRGELTDRSIELTRSDSSFTIDRADLFPSLHASYELLKDVQLMASYSRRIDRPRGWYLEPFLTWMDAYNVRTGNPALEPEYIDSYETGYQLPLGPIHHSTELYYRVTHNLVERITSAWPGQAGVTLHSLDNVGTSHALGTEVMFTGSPLEWLNVNLMGNFYNKRIVVDQGRDNEDFSWSSRLNLTFRPSPLWKIQTSGMYNSPVVSSQGERKAFYMINGAVELSNSSRTLTAIFQARDIFNTAQYSRINRGPNLYTEFYFDRTGPFLGLTLRYNFNHYRQQRREGQRDMSEPDDFM